MFPAAIVSRGKQTAVNPGERNMWNRLSADCAVYFP